MELFPIVELEGSHYEIGRQHGELLQDRIVRTIKFYSNVFNRTETEIFEVSNTYDRLIQRKFPDYYEEMNGIANGADVDFQWILALNARSEILTQFVTECTAIVDTTNGLLAQNWDWAQELEQLAVIMRINYPSEHRILMMTEPGIIGKIGLNSSGIGVTLNFLHIEGKLDGVPIHLLLRAILDTTSLDQARHVVSKYARGKAGNIIVSDGSEYSNFELANSDYTELRTGNQFVHTNHYLSNPKLNDAGSKLESSFARYDRASQLIENTSMNLDRIIKLLHDDQSNLPICRPYILDEEIGNIGTISTLAMDLINKKLFYTPGNPFDHNFKSIEV